MAFAFFVAVLVLGPIEFSRSFLSENGVASGMPVSISSDRDVYDPDPNRPGFFAFTGDGRYAGWSFEGSSSSSDEGWHLLMAVHHPNPLSPEALQAMGEALMQMWHGGSGESLGIYDLVLREHKSDVVVLKA